MTVQPSEASWSRKGISTCRYSDIGSVQRLVLRLGMWTFPTKNIEKVHQNALVKGITVVLPPTMVKTAELGKARVMTMLAPNGFLIEVFEK